MPDKCPRRFDRKPAECWRECEGDAEADGEESLESDRGHSS
jgi:hypothetical protein